MLLALEHCCPCVELFGLVQILHVSVVGPFDINENVILKTN